MKTSVSILSLAGLSALLFTMGCIASGDDVDATDDTIAPDEFNVDTVESEIINGQPAQVWMQQRAVSISTGCTGTIISNTHILTAAHCLPVVGSTTVQFYNNSTIPSGPAFGITNVNFRAGVNPFNDDLTDVNGDFADIAILTLAQPIPATSVKSPLAIFYPGSDAFGIQVGRGEHDGLSNDSSVLRFAFNGLYSDDNSDGYFYTNDDRSNGGDSGGPIYTGGELQGTLWGDWIVAFAMRNKYTAVSYYLPWILSTIGFTGSFSQTFQNLMLVGTPINTIGTSDHNICKLACMQDSSCFGYSFQPFPSSLCHLHSDDIGTDLSWPGTISAIRQLPPPLPTSFTYTASNTNNAQQNTTNRTIAVNAGDRVTVATCNLAGATFTGDTFLRLFSGATQVAFDDDSCGAGGRGSSITHTAAATGNLEVRAGCFDTSSCTGTVVIQVSKNLAAGKPATQSSTSFGGEAARAVDGNTDGNYANGSVTHTGSTPQAWWQVDLGEVTDIGKVVLYNRTDCCSDRLANFDVLLSNDGINWQTAIGFEGTAPPRTALPIDGAGRFVRVRLRGTNYLSLAEVQVIAP